MVVLRLGAFVPVAEPDFSRGVSSFGGESAGSAGLDPVGEFV
jgi:hypothetical protein